MCGIIAYVGGKQARDLLIEGLKRLEYRGYDSAGIAVLNDGMQLAKTTGRVRVLEEQISAQDRFNGTLGIASTPVGPLMESPVNATPTLIEEARASCWFTTASSRILRP